MAGYSQTPLLKKLGIKPGASLYIYDAPPSYFKDIGELPQDVIKKSNLIGKFDFIHLFVKENEVFQVLFVVAKKCLVDDGMLWISWPKNRLRFPQTSTKISSAISDCRWAWLM